MKQVCNIGVNLGLILLLSCSLPAAPAEEAAGNPETYLATRGCGAFSVALAARRAGAGSIRYIDAEARTDPDGDGACSMKELVDALESFGVVAQAMHTDELTLPDGIAILHVKSTARTSTPDHFVVAVPSPGGHRVLAPEHIGMPREAKGALDRWDGDFVLVELVQDRAGSLFWEFAVLVLAGAGLLFCIRFLALNRR